MHIKTPSERAYYPASHYGSEELLCWIPAEEYDQMTAQGQLSPSVACDYPDGIEVEVSETGFAEVALDVGVEAQAIKSTYGELRNSGRLPESGIVDGRTLEAMARERSRARPTAEDASEPLDEGSTAEVPEPDMTEGDDPLSVMRRLA